MSQVGGIIDMTFNWRDHLVPGVFIDIKDSYKNWCLGYIEDFIKAKNTIIVRFEGWLTKYNEEIPIKSERLAPLRFHTIGYTGPRVDDQRDYFVYIEEEVIKAQEKIDNLLKTNLNSVNPWEFTQFVRGELFVLIDSLLSTSFYQKRLANAKVSQNEMKTILTLCEKYVLLYCKWLQKLSAFQNDFIEAKRNQTLYFLSPSACIVSAGPEFGETFKLFFGFSSRTQICFSNYALEKNEPQWFSLHIIEILKKNGGLSQITNYIKAKEKQNNIPFKLLLIILEPFVVGIKVKFSELVNFAKDVTIDICSKLNNLDDEVIRFIDGDTIDRFYLVLESFFNAINVNNGEEAALTEIVKFGIRLMKSPWIDNKIEGIKLIKKMCAKRCGIEMFWRNSKHYAEKLREYNFLEVLTGVNAHEEVIKFSTEVLLLMNAINELSIGNIKTIWNKCLENNGAISNSLMEVLIVMTSSFGIPIYRELFKWLEETPLKCFTESLVKFAEAYTVCAMKIPLEKQGAGKKLYNLELFWNITINTETDEKVKDMGFEALARLIKNDKNLKLEYCIKAGTCISEQKNIERALKVLQVFDYVTLSTSKNETTLDNFLDTFQIISSIIKECDSLHKEVKRILNVSPNLRKDILNQCFTKQSSFTFGNQLKLYMDFLHAACSSSKKLLIDLDQFDKLWNCFYLEQFSEDHCNILWETLEKRKLEYNPQLSTYGLFKGLESTKKFYDQFLSNPGKLNAANISEKGIQCFRSYYNLFNPPHSNIENQIGFELLWNIALEAEKQAARKWSSSWLVNIYKSKIAESIQDKKKDLVVSFLEKLLSKGCESTSKFQAALVILEDFNNAIDCEFIEQFFDPSEFEKPPTYYINVILPEPYGELQIIISRNLTTFDLIRKISNSLRVSEERLSILYGGRNVTMEPLAVINNYSTVNIKMNLELLSEQEKPRYLLINYPRLFDKLLEMFAIPTPETSLLVWNLLEKLPLSNFFKTKFKEILMDTNSWEDYLKIKDYARETYAIYALSVFQNIILKDDPAKFMDYNNKLINTKGYAFVLKIFNESIEQISQKMRLKCILFALKVLNVSMEYGSGICLYPDLASQKEMWNKIKLIIKGISTELYGVHLKTAEKKELINQCIKHQILLAKLNNTDLYSLFLNEEYLAVFVQGILKGEKNGIVSENMLLIWNEIIQFNRKDPETEITFAENFLKGNLKEAIKKDSKEYFNLLGEFIALFDEKTKLFINGAGYLDTTIIELLHKLSDTTANPGGCINFLSGILIYDKQDHLNPKLKELVNSLILFLFGKCDCSNPKPMYTLKCCNIPDVRSSAIRLLEILIDRFKLTSSFVEEIYPYHLFSSWRSNKLIDWIIYPENTFQVSAEYVGLVNLGATCYLNSLIQQLFMIPEFRHSVLSCENAIEKSHLGELQKIMGVLFEKNYSKYEPKSLCDILEINTNKQQDVSEFLTVLFEIVQKDLENIHQSTILKDLFEFSTATEIICKKNNHHSETVSTSYMLGLQVKNMKNIAESLNSFISIETLQGDNAYHCNACGEKVVAEKRETIKTLPNILIIQLKRFENIYGEGNQKVNSYFEFPLELNLEEYTQHAQIKRDIDRGISSNIHSIELPKDYYKYKLKGVIIQSGTLNGGHYYSFIEDRTTPLSQWLEFNDANIKKFDINNLKEEAFGYTKEPDDIKKAKTAYLLFYTRELMIPHSALEIIHCRNQIVEQRDWRAEFAAIRTNQRKGIIQELPVAIKSKLKEEREANLLRQFMFHPDYLNFVVNIIKIQPIPEDKKYIKKEHGYEMQIFALIFLLTTAIRSKMIDSIIQLSTYINECLKNHKGFCIAVACMFSNADIIREFIIDCPKLEARKLIVSLLRAIMSSLYPDEKEAIEIYIENGKFLEATHLKKMATSKFHSPKKQLLNKDDEEKNQTIIKVSSINHDIPFLILLIDALVQQANKITKPYCGQYFQILSDFCELGSKCKQYLQSFRFLEISLEILGVNKNMEYSEYAVNRIPHFSWEGRPFFDVLQKEEPDIRDYMKETFFGEQTQYIFYFLNQLIKHEGEEPLQNKILKLEKKIIKLLCEESSLNALFKYATFSKYTSRYLCEFLLELCNFEKIFDPLLSFLEKNLSICQHKDFDIYLTSLNVLLSSNNDIFFQKTMEKFLAMISKELRKPTNSQVFTTNTSYIDFLTQLPSNSSKCLDYFKNGQRILWETVDAAIDWIQNNKVPNSQTTLFRNSNKKLYSGEQKIINQCRKASDLRLAALNEIKNKKFISGKDGNDEMQIGKIKYKVGEQWDIYISLEGQWVVGTVVISTDELVKFKYSINRENLEILLDAWSDKIAPFKSKLNNDKFIENEMLSNL